MIQLDRIARLIILLNVWVKFIRTELPAIIQITPFYGVRTGIMGLVPGCLHSLCTVLRGTLATLMWGSGAPTQGNFI